MNPNTIQNACVDDLIEIKVEATDCISTNSRFEEEFDSHIEVTSCNEQVITDINCGNTQEFTTHRCEEDVELHYSPIFVVNTLNEFHEVLSQHEKQIFAKYSATASRVNFFGDRMNLSNFKVFYTKKYGSSVYNFNNVPFLILGSKTYQCEQGCRNMVFKRSTDIQIPKTTFDNDKIFSRKRNFYKKKIPTKKLNCTAEINVKRVILFPQFKLSSKMAKIRKAKQICISRIKANLDEVYKEEKYVFCLPLPTSHTCHNHVFRPLEENVVDKRVLNKLQDFVIEGETDAKVIQELLKTFVNDELGLKPLKRKKGCVFYYPKLETIRSALFNTRYQLRRSLINQISSSSQQHNAHCLPYQLENSNSLYKMLPCKTDKLKNCIKSDDEQMLIIKTIDGEVDEVHEKTHWITKDDNEELQINESEVNLILKCENQIRSLENILCNIAYTDLKNFTNDLQPLIEKWIQQSDNSENNCSTMQ